MTGVSEKDGVGQAFWDMYVVLCSSKEPAPWQAVQSAIEASKVFQVDVVECDGSGQQCFTVTFRPAGSKLDGKSHPALHPATSDDEPSRYWLGIINSAAPNSGDSFSSDSDSELELLARCVVEHKLVDEGMAEANKEFEAMLGMKLAHPNIVRAFKYAVAPRKVVVHGNGQASPASASTSPSTSPLGSDPKEQLWDPATVSPRQWYGAVKALVVETWILLELCSFGNLQDTIDQRGFLTMLSKHSGSVNMPWVLRTLAEVASAMQYIHSQDIVHGDLTCTNVLLATNLGTDARPFAAKISDFGLSRTLQGDIPVQPASFGTVTHMPPELLKDGRLSRAADVYSFGVMMWTIYTGRALAEQCLSPDDRARPSFTQVAAVLQELIGAVEACYLQVPNFPAYLSETSDVYG
ncbi:hypothetical protein WJX72_010653 [[Myrmecia] bisecta]|uniref:Protein kinase domain-containing protein n=1 Tax=[Myrmecia] bisecta TaxID=41462 RepID=A0AAW1P6N8_9CHLO